jgi:choline kinase
MVYSLFLTKKLIKDDVVIVYGDIVFDKLVYDLVNINNNILPVNINWLKNWKKRMSTPNILKDAENLVIKNDYIAEIGTKIDKNNFPKFQFMGIIKLKKESYLNCYNFFKKIKNNRIDMTSFLNLCIKNKILSLKIKKYKKYWYEIDTISDFNFAQRELKKLFK